MALYKAYSKWIGITILAVAMAFLESAVVIYLRELYYPSGFGFPMVSMPERIALTELLREAATLLMLLAIGFLAGENFRQRFAWFLYSFAVWDLFYYLFLKLILNWPSSWFTWDILFLLPVVWTGPVLAPVLVSFTMTILAITLLYIDKRTEKRVISNPVKWMIILGSALIFLSFIWDYTSFMLRQYSLIAMLDLKATSAALNQYIPFSFNWFLLLAGEVSVFSGIVLAFLTNRQNR